MHETQAEVLAVVKNKKYCISLSFKIFLTVLTTILCFDAKKDSFDYVNSSRLI